MAAREIVLAATYVKKIAKPLFIRCDYISRHVPSPKNTPPSIGRSPNNPTKTTRKLAKDFFKTSQ